MRLARERRMTIATVESCTARALAQDGSGRRSEAAASSPYGGECRGGASDGQGRARAMPADIAIAITGVTAPEPDEDGDPVGLVYVAVDVRNGRIKAARHEFGDRGRDEICRAAMSAVLALAASCSRPGCRLARDLSRLDRRRFAMRAARCVLLRLRRARRRRGRPVFISAAFVNGKGAPG
jgi:hypothetical protein